jgi:hypothetical protein
MRQHAPYLEAPEILAPLLDQHFEHESFLAHDKLT